VFIGNILGKTGAQSKRQHELSVSMKEHFNTELAYIVSCIVKEGEELSDSIGRSAACFLVGRFESSESPNVRSGEELVSFCYVSAALCLREIERAHKPPKAPKAPTYVGAAFPTLQVA